MTVRSTAKRLIISSAAFVDRGPPRIVTGSRWLIAPSSTCSRKPATSGTVSCWMSAATRELASCSSAERHHITSSPTTVTANQVTPEAIDSTGNSGSDTLRCCRAARALTRSSVTATQAKEPR